MKTKRFVSNRTRPLTQVALGTLAMFAASAAFARPAAAETFGDPIIALDWRVDGSTLGLAVEDRLNGGRVAITAPFSLQLADGTRLGPDAWRLQAPPAEGALPADPKAARLSERGPRRTLTAQFEDAQQRFRVELRFVQPPGAAYLREEATITALRQDEAVARVELMSFAAPFAQVVGDVDGSPVVAGNLYWQFEDPLSKSSAHPYRGTSELWVERSLPLLKGRPITYSEAVGVAHPGQLRRDFAAYVEAERAHPSRTFLQYNSWYDIGYFTPYTAAQALDRIDRFGQELTVKRGVKLDSFLFDDGWDDRSGSWGFSKDFPDGFRPLAAAAAKYGAAPGIWLSPWGGYGKPKEERVAAGKAKGYEVEDGGFALSGPRYYARFHEVALDLVTRQGVNQFKIDGTGNANRVFPGSRFDSDFAAAISLIGDLRKARPDVFINLTTGTYPSPAWLRTADSIWRGGEDHAFTGVGPPRERWITYRDADTYHHIVMLGPLFPLNALMLHGIIYAKSANRLDSDPGGDFANEVHSYFASGVALQELYVTPTLLTPANWDTVATAAKWARRNAAVLKDSHWVGGDPGRGEVYGWAAWSPGKAFITLRNPDAAPQAYSLDVGRALELPAGAPRAFAARSVWGKGPARHLRAGAASQVTLQPFEVLTLELRPEGPARR